METIFFEKIIPAHVKSKSTYSHAIKESVLAIADNNDDWQFDVADRIESKMGGRFDLEYFRKLIDRMVEIVNQFEIPLCDGLRNIVTTDCNQWDCRNFLIEEIEAMADSLIAMSE